VYTKTFTRLWNPWLEAWNTPTTVYWTPPAANANSHSFVRGRKRYELANHLGIACTELVEVFRPSSPTKS
jgi:hypothetical protein